MKKIISISTAILITFSALAQQEFQDCTSAYLLCNSDPVSIENVPSNANHPQLNNTGCLKGDFPNSNNIWFKWKVEKPGNLGFLLLPMDGSDDLDFVLFKMTDGLENCQQKEVIRCMASGENRGNNSGKKNLNCSGVTGLAQVSADIVETAGCAAVDDNFLAELSVVEGEIYALFVNNYYSSHGFILEFTGSATFAPIAAECTTNSSPSANVIELNGVKDEGLFIKDIYPNPASAEITLPVYSEETAFENGEIQIVSLHGDIVERNPLSIIQGLNETNIKIGHLPKGVYFLKIVLGENIHVTRFTKF